MPVKRYKYMKSPPLRSDISVYSMTEQIVCDALLDDISSSSCIDHLEPMPQNVCKENWAPPPSSYLSRPPTYRLPTQPDVKFANSVPHKLQDVETGKKQRKCLAMTDGFQEEMFANQHGSDVDMAAIVTPHEIQSNTNKSYSYLMPPPTSLRPQRQRQLPNKDVVVSEAVYSDEPLASSPKKPKMNKHVFPAAPNQCCLTPTPPAVSPTATSRSSTNTCRALKQLKVTDYISKDKMTTSLMSLPGQGAETQTRKGRVLEEKVDDGKGDVYTPSPKAKRRRSTPQASNSSEGVTDSSVEFLQYILDNQEKITSLIGQTSSVVCLISHDKWQGDRLFNASVPSIQLSLACLEPGTTASYQWESFIITASTKTSTQTLQCLRSIALKCFGRCPVCNDAKSILSQLIDIRVLMEKDVLDLHFNDVCVANWLLNSDGFQKRSLYSMTDVTDKDGQARVAEEMLNIYTNVSQQLQDMSLDAVYQLELSLLPLLVVMECKGLAVDMQELDRVDRLLGTEIKRLEKKAADCVGSPISLNSTVQLRQVLYDRLQLDKKLPKSTLYKTAKCQEISTGEGVLHQLVTYHPLPQLVLDHRQLYKVRSTYITAMRGHITDGVLRTQWDQTSASTGRVQSIKPNIQTIPKSSLTWSNGCEDISVCARSIYTSRPGYTYLSVDFKQIEFRIFAHVTNDDKLSQLLRDDTQDIFCRLSAMWMNKDMNNISMADRERTKRIVYSVMYGVGRYKLSQQLNITPMEAQSVMSRFLHDFPGIQQFANQVVASCRQKGYVESVLGRRRLLDNINSKDFKLRTQAERQAVNFSIQGSAADICKLAMKEMSVELRQNHIDASLLVQIHDELLYEVKDLQLSEAKEIFVKSMETDGGKWHGGLELTVPLRIAVTAGKNWAAMKSY